MDVQAIAVQTGCVANNQKRREFYGSLPFFNFIIKDMMTEYNTEWENNSSFHELLNTCSPSCREYESATIFKTWLSTAHCQTSTDILGNITGCINPQSEYKILLTAHMDEVGLQITHINSNGLIFFRRVGGIEPMSLCGHEVTILNKRGPVNGIIGRNAQNYNFTEQGLSFKMSDLWIDIGADTKEEATEKVWIGDFVSFKPNSQKIGKSRICAKGLDNKTGLFIVAQTIKKLSKEQLSSIGIYVAATVQEEIRLRGIAPCVYNIKPTIGFVVDVGFATDVPGSSQYDEPTFCLGKGVGLIHNADNNPILVDCLKQVAESKKIPIQETVGHTLSGGTDAMILQLTADGVATANISIPCRYMHSHTEMCDWEDIEYAIELLTQTILKIDKESNKYLFK